MTVAELLHDADRIHGGMGMALLMHDHTHASAMRKKRNELVKQAHALDPEHNSAEWKELNEYLIKELLTII